jgi:hypothetical protein
MSVAGIGLGMGMECVLGLRARGVNQLCVDGATMQLAKNEGKLHAYDVTIYLMHPAQQLLNTCPLSEPVDTLLQNKIH